MSQTTILASVRKRTSKLSFITPEIFARVLWLVLALWGWHWLGPTWIAAIRPSRTQIIDYYQDWGAARNYWVGLPVYTPHSMSIPRHLGLPSNPVKSIEYNAHPPTSVLLALPLARFDYPDAVMAWNVISLVLFLASLMLVALVLPVSRTVLLPLLAVLPYCLPLLGNLQMGQLTLVLGFLVTVIWALSRAGRVGAAGLVLGSAAAIKLFPAYLIVYFIGQRRLRPLLTTLLSLLVLTLATVLVLGVETYHDYVSVVLPRLGTFQGFGYNLSIAGLWHKLFDPGAEVKVKLIPPLWPSLTLARWGTLISDLLISLIIILLAYRARTLAQRDLVFSLAMTGMLLVSPVAWDITLLMLLLPIIILACSPKQLRWMPTALLLILVIIWLPQPILTMLATFGGIIDVATPFFILGAASIKFYALLGTFALGLTAFRIDEVNTQNAVADGAAML